MPKKISPIKKEINDKYKEYKKLFFESDFENVRDFFEEVLKFDKKATLTGYFNRQTNGWSNEKEIRQAQKVILEAKQVQKKVLDNPNKLIKRIKSELPTRKDGKINYRASAEMSKQYMLELMMMISKNLNSEYSDGLISTIEVLKNAGSLVTIVNFFDKIIENAEKVNSYDLVEGENGEVRKVQAGDVSGVSQEGESDGMSGEGGLKDHNHRKSMFVVVESDK